MALHLHADDLVARIQLHSDDAVGDPSGDPHVALLKADGKAVFCGKEDILRIVSHLYLNELVVLTEEDGLEAGLSHIGVFFHAGLFHHTVLCGHHQIFFIVDLLHGDRRRYLFSRLKLEKINNGCAPGRSSGLRDLIGL